MKLSERDRYTISTNKQRLDRLAVHAYLTRSDWSPGVTFETVNRAIQNSLCFGLYHEGRQVGFARVVTDRCTFAFLADVYVLEEHRGRGLAKRLIGAVMRHDVVNRAGRCLLGTRDAHGLYRQFGFEALPDPARMMAWISTDPRPTDGG